MWQWLCQRLLTLVECTEHFGSFAPESRTEMGVVVLYGGREFPFEFRNGVSDAVQHLHAVGPYRDRFSGVIEPIEAQ